MTGTEAAEWLPAGCSSGLMMESVVALGLMGVGVDASLLSACSSESEPDAEIAEGEATEPRDEELSANALSPLQASTVLTLIDDICADTWCSGDYDFGFRGLTCSRQNKTCTLTLQVFPRDEEPSQNRSYWRSCKTPDFEGFNSLVHTWSGGYQSLADGYYDALTECTTRIVSHLP